MTNLFQTKVKSEYVAQMEQKDMQTQWLESEMEKINTEINAYKSEWGSKEATFGFLIQILGGMAAIIEHLRTDILEPANYDKLFKVATGFLMSTVLQQFKTIVEPKDAPVTAWEVYIQSQSITYVIPRLYAMATAAAVALEQLNKFRAKLIKNPANENSLKKRGLPSTFKQIRAQKKAIFEELNELASGIQDPIRHIFYREYMFQVMKPHMDLELYDEELIDDKDTIKDLELSSRFMLDNYVEENRLWCRTAYDVGRTKNEIARRERKRAYLQELVQSGFMELAGFCAGDERRNQIIIDLLAQVRNCGDPTAAATTLYKIVKTFSEKKIVKNLDALLGPICAYATGHKTYVSIIQRLKKKNLINDKVFTKLCHGGMHLARSIVDLMKTDPEEMQKLIKVADEENEATTRFSPWLEIINELLQMAVEMWPADLSKMSVALEGLVLVIYPSMENKVVDVAKMVNPKAGIVIVKAVPTDQPAGEQPEAVEELKQPEGGEEEEEEEHENDKIVNEFEKKKRFEDYVPIAISAEDQEALVTVLSKPMQGLESDLMSQFLFLPPVVIIRKYFTTDLNIKFCKQISDSLVEKPILRTHEEYLTDKAFSEKQAELITDTMYTVINTAPFEFARIIPCCHNATYVFKLFKQNSKEISNEAKKEVVGALFYALIRDGLLKEAYESIRESETAGPGLCAALYVHCLEYLSKSLKGEYKFAYQVTEEDLFNCIQRLILSYENAPRSDQQPSTLVYLLGLILQCTIIESEKVAILKRLHAACITVFLREERGVCLAWLSRVYNQLSMAEEKQAAIKDAQDCQEKWGSSVTKLKIENILQE